MPVEIVVIRALTPHVAPSDAAPSDLQFLTDENVAEIGTHGLFFRRFGLIIKICLQGVR